jgi:death-on-curing family protein
MQILAGLLNEFEEWRRGESDKEPLIIEIHDKVVSNDPYTEQGVINLGDVSIAIYSAIEDLMRSNDISRSLAVLTYHLITSHPFVDGNKRTALGLLLHILHELFFIVFFIIAATGAKKGVKSSVSNGGCWAECAKDLNSL